MNSPGSRLVRRGLPMYRPSGAHLLEPVFALGPGDGPSPSPAIHAEVCRRTRSRRSSLPGPSRPKIVPGPQGPAPQQRAVEADELQETAVVGLAPTWPVVSSRMRG